MLTLVTELRVRTLCHHSSILLGPLGWRREGWVGQGDRTSPWPLLDELGSPTVHQGAQVFQLRFQSRTTLSVWFPVGEFPWDSTSFSRKRKKSSIHFPGVV